MNAEHPPTASRRARTHSIERMLHTLDALGIETDQLRQLPLKPLQPMTTAATTAR